MSRNYLDWLTSLPWNCLRPEIIDIESARRVLDEDHYGLNDVKSRILEFMAVSKLKRGIQRENHMSCWTTRSGEDIHWEVNSEGAWS